jgi:hypothetical protein
MLVFIDESGDCGMKFDRGSSSYFVITAVLFGDNFSADACDRGIDELRRKLSIRRDFEFHFTNCNDSLRHKFLEHIAFEEFRYYAFILNKQKLFADSFRNDPNEMYRVAAKFTCENARPHFHNAKVVIDKTGDREFKRKLEAALKSIMTDADGQCQIRKVKMEHSHSNNLVQLADMVCGSVARDYNSGHSAAGMKFRQIVRKREERVQFWPK